MQPQPTSACTGAVAEPIPPWSSRGLGLEKLCLWGSGDRRGLGLRMGTRSAQAAPSLCLLHLLQTDVLIPLRKHRGVEPSEPESGFGVPGPVINPSPRHRLGPGASEHYLD